MGGKRIAYLDHDDEYCPDYLARWPRISDETAAVLVFAYDIVRPDGQSTTPAGRPWQPPAHSASCGRWASTARPSSPANTIGNAWGWADETVQLRWPLLLARCCRAGTWPSRSDDATVAVGFNPRLPS